MCVGRLLICFETATTVFTDGRDYDKVRVHKGRRSPFFIVAKSERGTSAITYLHRSWRIPGMQTLFRSSVLGALAWPLCMSRAMAVSEAPVELEIRQVDGNPAACLPIDDKRAGSVIQIRTVGVARPTGPASPDVTYWWFEMPADARPVYLKRGECLVYGQTVQGAIVRTPPKPLDLDRTYYISIIPGGDSGPVYGAAFCTLERPGGDRHVAVPQRGRNPCAVDH